MCDWAQLLKDEDLSDPTSIKAKYFRPDFCLPYPFLLELLIVNLLKVTPLHETSPEKAQHCIFGPTDERKGSDSQSSRKNIRSETGFFNPRFLLHKNWPKREITTRRLSPPYKSAGWTQATVVMDKMTQKSKGYGFVTFKGMDGAHAALENPEKNIDVSL